MSRIEEVFDQVFDLLQFNIDRDVLVKKVRMCLIRYSGKNFEIFPSMMDTHLIIVDKESWIDEFKVNIDLRNNTKINKEHNNVWFSRTTKEIVRVRILFDSFKDEFINLRALARAVMKKEYAILNFDWLDEKTYGQWNTKHSMTIERMHMVVEDKEINWVENDEPQVEEVHVAP